MQSILVAIILVACAAYTARRLYRRFTSRSTGNPHCESCPLADTCRHKHDAAQQASCTECGSHNACCH